MSALQEWGFNRSEIDALRSRGLGAKE